MSSLVDSLIGTTALGSTMDPPSPFPSTVSPLNTPMPVPTSPPITTGVSPASSSVVSPAPLPSLSSYGDPGGNVFVLTDGDGSIYTTTIYSTKTPSPSASTSASSPSSVSTSHFGAIIAGIAGGVGLLFLIIGVIWFIRARRAKRRAGIRLIRDRKFYPDRYNQTLSSNRHSKCNEIEPGPVVVQPPLRRPPHPLPPPLPHETPSPSPGPLSKRTLSYPNHIASPRTRGSWAGTPPTDGVLADSPPLTRHRVPYLSSPSQPLTDRYTMLPSRSTSGANIPFPPLRFAPNPSSYRPHHVGSPSTHRRHHSNHSYHGHPHRQEHDIERNPYFPPIPIPHPPPTPMRTARRNTVFISPPTSPSTFSIVSSSTQGFPATRTEPTATTLSSRPSVARSTFSSTDPLVLMNDTTPTKRMMVTNPDLDADLESDTEPDKSSGNGGGGGKSPSPTDIIRLYGGDRDQDTSLVSCMTGDITDKDPPTLPTIQPRHQ